VETVIEAVEEAEVAVEDAVEAKVAVVEVIQEDHAEEPTTIPKRPRPRKAQGYLQNYQTPKLCQKVNLLPKAKMETRKCASSAQILSATTPSHHATISPVTSVPLG
jgi:hypothetical protein